MTDVKVTNGVARLKRPSDEYPRHYVPAELDLSDMEAIEPYFRELHKREIDSAEGLEKWLMDLSELYSVVHEEDARLYIAMTCATDDEEAKKRYFHFVENIEPQLKSWGNKLDKKLIDIPYLSELDSSRYGVLIRDVKNELELFREENIPIETELTKLSQEYQSIQGAMTVEYKGKEYTMQQMAAFLEEPNREVRQETWELASKRRLQDADALDELFNRMMELRNKSAANAGFDNYMDFRFKQLGRFDYTPDDCLVFHDSVEKVVMPVYNKILSERKSILGTETLRPWDLSVDPYNRPPLKPFSKAEELMDGCRRIFEKVNPTLGSYFKRMIENGLLDLESHKGKAPGGYQAGLQEVRLPFIFMNAVGLNNDVITLLHEGGHSFHQFAVRNEPLVHYRHAPMEFSEVASMSMELLGANYIDEFYNPAEAARARKKHLERIILIFPWVATIDAFQHWIYSHPKHTIEERDNYWLELFGRFGGDVDYSGYEDILRKLWQRQLHIFEVPFYYIEYGIAQLGALQVWRNSKADMKKAVDDYLHGLSLGGSRRLPELFEGAAIRFDFSEETIKPLVDTVVEELDKLSEIEKSE